MQDLSIFEKPSIKKRSHCMICGGRLIPLIDLPALPITDIYITEKPEKRYGLIDQSLCFCRSCGHGQLEAAVDPHVLYPSGYALRTSQSSGAKAANDAFATFIKSVIGDSHFRTIVEIGCNDMYLLKTLENQADQLVGIDPVLAGKEKDLSQGKIMALGSSFEKVDLPELRESLILNSHLIEHLEDPKLLMQKISEKATPSTLCIFQFPLLDYLVKNLRFDQIYHHHLHYFSHFSFARLISDFGFEVIHSEVNLRYWGSLLVAFKKVKSSRPDESSNPKLTPGTILAGFKAFRTAMQAIAKQLDLLWTERKISYGAGLQLPVFAYHLGSDFTSFESVVDDDKSKEGKYYLNLPVQIKDPASVSAWEEVNILVTAVGFARAILPKLLSLNPKRIIVPLGW